MLVPVDAATSAFPVGPFTGEFLEDRNTSPRPGNNGRLPDGLGDEERI